MKYSLSTLLALLQQFEYDFSALQSWAQFSRTEEEIARLNETEPERWTTKLKLIRSWSTFLSPIFGSLRSIYLSLLLLAPAQYVAAQVLIFRAQLKLRRLQQDGLRVIAVAGSYGKTSVKHGLHHVLSTKHNTLMTPESVNTALGIAHIVLHRLTPRHEIFITEFGEFSPGDTARFLELLQPEVGVLTPIGFAHQERFGGESGVQQELATFVSHAQSPQILLVDDENQDLFPFPKHALFYGEKKSSAIRFSQIEAGLGTTEATVDWESAHKKIESSITGEGHLRNLLPAIVLLGKENLTAALRSLHYIFPTPRRLEIIANANGTIVIDNSYNTNPAAWRTTLALVRKLNLEPSVVLTAGFVELDDETTRNSHEEMARDITQYFSGAGIIRTRVNSDLIDTLSQFAEKNEHFSLVIGNSQAEVLSLMTQQGMRMKYLLLEGGCREMYQ